MSTSRRRSRIVKRLLQTVVSQVGKCVRRTGSTLADGQNLLKDTSSAERASEIWAVRSDPRELLQGVPVSIRPLSIKNASESKRFRFRSRLPDGTHLSIRPCLRAFDAGAATATPYKAAVKQFRLQIQSGAGGHGVSDALREVNPVPGTSEVCSYISRCTSTRRLFSTLNTTSAKRSGLKSENRQLDSSLLNCE